ncbi:Spore germination protein YndE [Peribacillus sp. Bi96]|uniref:GerAB/ArcD/ProY family transporter n=1 Tax=Peribacillus sp. Bi96 TaxID=2884273 RepID=UPI001DA78954|nr:GerAB/ArcD/ProY family transporter [Peribacillus sp. Bi96]CAH0267345.1 Spore germination protein YndE [Peribacillus sp. Bi96]
MKEKINTIQFFCLIVLFEIGSALLLEVGRSAGKYGWISLIVAGLLGCILYLVYTKLHTYYPSLPLTQYTQLIWGKHIGIIISFLYALYFMYMAARILRDFTALLLIMAYRNTSPVILAALMMGVCMYGIKQGIQTIGRVALAGFVLLFSILFLIIIFQWINGLLDVENVRPIIPRDWSPILHTIFPTALTIPFGEMIAFSMIFPDLDQKSKVKKIGLYAIIASCLFLAFSSIVNIMILNEDIVESSIFPLLSAASLVDIAHFITRLEALVVITLVTLGIFKLLVFFYCTVIGIADILQIKNQNKLILPIGLLILTLSFAIAPNYIEHIYIGIHKVPYYLHIPLQIVVPILLLLTAFIKNRKKHN